MFFPSKLQCCHIFDFTVFDHVLIFPFTSFLSFFPLEKRVRVIFYALFFKNIHIFLFCFPFSLFCFSSLLSLYILCALYLFFPIISIFISTHFCMFFAESKTDSVLFFTLYFLKNICSCLPYFHLFSILFFYTRCICIFSLPFTPFSPYFDFYLYHFCMFSAVPKTILCSFSCFIF